MIRIALIDDDAMVRTGLQMMVRADDITVVGEAADGEEGLALIEAESPDVVLLDIRMPVLDGLGVLERLQEAGTDGPAVLVLTTFDTDDYVLRALRQGAAGFLLKDTEPADLVAAIRAAARGEAVLAPTVTQQVISAATSGPEPAATGLADELTEREKDVARLLTTGRTNAEIAEELYISLATVKANVTRIFVKTGAENRVEAAIRLRDAGL
ncbi:response regulator [Brevibacterium otitidis]|uniref:Response regulator n=1 Tax=Brevibacterium otitidis TaxID=53364 RepID=A0ABV5X3V9_9MICO|nr:response regulator transcription factor [Brevibacterium otitidis]